MNMAVSDLLLGAVSLPIYIYGKADYLRLGKVKTNQDLFSAYIFVHTLSRKYRLYFCCLKLPGEVSRHLLAF